MRGSRPLGFPACPARALGARSPAGLPRPASPWGPRPQRPRWRGTHSTTSGQKRAALRRSSRAAAGFSTKGADGRWSGLDVDFCRALAAAAIGDADAVRFVPLEASERFPALLTRRVDLLAAGVTWTLGREVGLGVQFAGVLYHDRQGFLVPRASGVTGLAGLEGATLCLERGTTHVKNVADTFAREGWSYRRSCSRLAGRQAFFAGRCQALSGDARRWRGCARRAAGGPSWSCPTPSRPSPSDPSCAAEMSLAAPRWVLLLLIRRGARGPQADAAAALGGAPSPGRRRSTSKSPRRSVDPRWGERRSQRSAYGRCSGAPQAAAAASSSRAAERALDEGG
jgi:general L-amino acid transport system substrate-binding protein